jgi:RNA polymerase sigma factor (sigma-70 family)
MNNDTIEKPSLETLLTSEILDLVSATASQFYAIYGRRSKHSVMITQEDLASHGYLAATVAYKSFDPNLAFNTDLVTAFRTYAFPYIRSAMMTYCRKFSHPMSISEKSAREEWGTISSIGIVHIDHMNGAKCGGDESDQFDIPIGSGVDSLEQDINDYFFAGFTEFERKLVRDHMIDGYSLQELSSRYNISKSRAGEIIRGLTDRMRERAENYVEND